MKKWENNTKKLNMSKLNKWIPWAMNNLLSISFPQNLASHLKVLQVLGRLDHRPASLARFFARGGVKAPSDRRGRRTARETVDCKGVKGIQWLTT